MRKLIFLIALLPLMASGQTRFFHDVVTGDIDDIGDSAVFFFKTSKVGDCQGAKVAFTLVVQNTISDLDGEWKIGASNPEASKDFGVTHFETIVHDAMPFVIDTTNTTNTAAGMGYFEGTDSVYTKTVIVPDFPLTTPAFRLTANSLTAIDWAVYIDVVKEK